MCQHEDGSFLVKKPLKVIKKSKKESKICICFRKNNKKISTGEKAIGQFGSGLDVRNIMFN